MSIDRFLHDEDVNQRPAPATNLLSQKMGIHEWSYDNHISNDHRYAVPHRDKAEALADIKAEVGGLGSGKVEGDGFGAKGALTVLRHPKNVVQMLGGNLGGQVGGICDV